VKNTLIAKVIIILFLSFSAHSKQFNIIGGWGSTDCGEVLKDYDNSEVLNIVIQSYLNGVLTGMFIESSTGTTASSSALELNTINYCRANPLDTFIQAIKKTFYKVAKPRI